MIRPTIFNRVSSDRRGAIAVVFALAAIPMILAAGVATDLGRAYLVKAELHRALDAATLAVGTSTDTTPSVLTSVLIQTFNNNYHLSNIATPSAPTMVISNNIIDSNVSATIPMMLMAMVTPSLTVAAHSQINKQTSGIELVLALDTTGSMADNNKMVELKSAAHSLLSTIFGGQSSAQFAYVGIVPFSDTVNVGVANTSYVSPAPSTYDWGKDSHNQPLNWGGCVMAPASPYDQTDDFTHGSWAPYYWPSSC